MAIRYFRLFCAAPHPLQNLSVLPPHQSLRHFLPIMNTSSALFGASLLIMVLTMLSSPMECTLTHERPRFANTPHTSALSPRYPPSTLQKTHSIDFTDYNRDSASDEDEMSSLLSSGHITLYVSLLIQFSACKTIADHVSYNTLSLGLRLWRKKQLSSFRDFGTWSTLCTLLFSFLVWSCIFSNISPPPY